MNNNARGTIKTASSNNVKPLDVPILNMHLVTLKTLVNNVLSELKDRNQVFYHIRGFDACQLD